MNFNAVITVMAGAILAPSVFSAEYVSQETPAPSDINDLQSPIEFAFTDEPLTDKFFWKSAKQRLESAPDFWKDAKFELNARNYYSSRDNGHNNNKPEATTISGVLRFTSGWWNNIGMRVAYYNSTEVDANGPDTGLLAPGQKNISKLGEANLRIRLPGDHAFSSSVITLGRQALNLPFVNKHDIRQVPASHEAFTISRTNSDLDYFVGHVTKFKDYDSEDFVHMSEAAGALDSDDGVSIVGGRFSPYDNTSLGGVFYKGWDTFDTFFVEGTHETELIAIAIKGR